VPFFFVAVQGGLRQRKADIPPGPATATPPAAAKP
jgi:hypothetical protein